MVSPVRRRMRSGFFAVRAFAAPGSARWSESEPDSSEARSAVVDLFLLLGNRRLLLLTKTWVDDRKVVADHVRRRPESAVRWHPVG